ncbi:hypothetical protein JTE90_005776 [Oedothorax gibbosus]|nr:hypothetical protein JTE90_005776 [Oedothorax gibbosus]
MEIAFEYNRLVSNDGSFEYNISNIKYTLTNFQVYSSVDIGQAVVVELAVISQNYSLSNVRVHACLTYGVRPNSWDVNCSSGRPTTSNIENSDASRLFVPFPEAGTWYIRLHTSCCNRLDSKSRAFTCGNPETLIMFRVLSTPCVSQLCGRYGHCEHHTSGGLLFSTCKCLAGWKGWGCTDNSTAKSDSRLIAEVAVLLLSNIFFIPAIVLSAYRNYFSESWVYFATMITSVLFHACDAEVFSHCVLRKDVLQFGDTFLAILSVWFTLVVMSEFSRTFQTCVQVIGAVIIGCIVQYERDGMLVFLLPFSLGLVVLVTSWVIQCHKKRILFYPSAKIWLKSLIPGTALALTGLALFAFFETKDNYPFVHSAWHVLISLSIVFLLPKRKSTSERTEELGSSSALASS